MRPLAVCVVAVAVAVAVAEAPVAAGAPRNPQVQAAQVTVDVPNVLLLLLVMLGFFAGVMAGSLLRWLRRRMRARMDVPPPVPRSASPGASERGDARQGLRRVAAAIGVLAGAEVVLAEGHVLAAQIADAILVVLLVNVGRRDERRGRVDRFDPSAAAMRALALVALVRVVGLGLPLREISDVAGDILVAILIGVAAVRLAPAVGVSIRTLLAMPSPLIQLSTAVGGLALGVGAYLVGAPALSSPGDGVRVILLAVAAATMAAMVEEIVFRGLVQVSFQRLWRGAGAVAATGVYACVYVSVASVSLLLVTALAGLLFARSVMRTGVLGAAVVGHVLFAAAAAVVCPLLFGAKPPYVLPEPETGLTLGVAVLVGAVILLRGSAAPVARPDTLTDIPPRAPSTEAPGRTGERS